MYLGYFLVLINIVSLLSTIAQAIFGHDPRSEKFFKRSHLLLIDFLKLFMHAIGLFQGYLLIKATKRPVKQMSTQEINPQINVTRFTDLVYSKFKLFIMSVFGVILLQSIQAFIIFVFVDQEIEKKFGADLTKYNREVQTAGSTRDVELE